MGGGYGGGARFEWTLRVAGAGAAEMAWEEASESRFEWTLRVRGGARSEVSGRDGGAGDAEIAWEEATEGERGWRVKFACKWAQKNQTSEK